MSLQDKAIGGFFELELAAQKEEIYPGALKYQSARAAFLALLKNSPSISRVWMPSYICDSMLSPVSLAGKKIEHYSIDRRFAPANKILLKPGDILFYVNYFGVSHDNVIGLLEQYDPASLIIDCSQAFFSGPYDCLATIYSARKFFGVPDGGVLFTQKDIALPAEQDEDSLSRASHLLQRLAFSAEEGYESYKLAEESLADMKPKRMSKLTGALLSSIDYESIKIKRRENFKALHGSLGAYNSLTLNVDSMIFPMCYPFLPKKRISKQRLIEKRIFLPTYWPEVKDRVGVGEFERLLVNELLAIPCDQRYVEADVSRVIKEVKSELFSQGD